ncbi:hypothetical protein J2X54_001527 [Duganella sp. 3397]|uniref:hypothetical protein n=1 Tax=Duganella sp. 3397 TaxID=2817732 RepID=UPI00285632D6|nr:hypothetical protein [Duganella sp. 3397]MDR7049079.1 hypothetical protein [Duganella sp. 3397]
MDTAEAMRKFMGLSPFGIWLWARDAGLTTVPQGKCKSPSQTAPELNSQLVEQCCCFLLLAVRGIIGVRLLFLMNSMSSQKLTKILILAAMAAVALSVVGYVFVVVADYTDCQRIEAAEMKKGKKVSCRDVKAGMAAE